MEEKYFTPYALNTLPSSLVDIDVNGVYFIPNGDGTTMSIFLRNGDNTGWITSQSPVPVQSVNGLTGAVQIDLSFNATTGGLTITGGASSILLYSIFEKKDSAIEWSRVINAPAFIITETDPTVPAHVKVITTGQITEWDAQKVYASQSGFFWSGPYPGWVPPDLGTYTSYGNINIRNTGYWYGNSVAAQSAGAGVPGYHLRMTEGSVLSSAQNYGYYAQVYFDTSGRFFGRGLMSSHIWNMYWHDNDFNQKDVNRLKGLVLSTVKGRYIKITSHNNTPLPGTIPAIYFCLSEIQVFSNEVNVSLGKPVGGTAISISGSAIDTITNGATIYYDYFGAANDGYLVVDLQSIRDISHIVIYNGYFIGTLDVWYSEDGTNYFLYGEYDTTKSTIYGTNLGDYSQTKSSLAILQRKWDNAGTSILTGQYTPTTTFGTAIPGATVTCQGFRWKKFDAGNAQVTGVIRLENVPGNTTADLRVSLPITTSFTGAYDLTGVWALMSGSAFSISISGLGSDMRCSAAVLGETGVTYSITFSVIADFKIM